MSTVAIWNDLETKVCRIEELKLEENKTRGFLIFRKIYIEFSRDFKKESITKSYLAVLFEKYGEIEAIEIVNADQNPNHAKRKPFAYITFVDSLAAFRAVENYSTEEMEVEYGFSVQPADTWHQPHTNDGIADSPTNPNVSMDILNDDCLLKIFEFCDFDALSNLFDVSRRFQSLLKRENPKYKAFSMQIGVYGANVNLNKIRRTLRYVGQSVRDFNVTCYYNEKPVNFHRILFKIAQYIGNNIEKFTLQHAELTPDVIQLLQPVLARIKTLKILNWNYLNCDVKDFCPNLVKFKACKNTEYDLSPEPWPTLENFGYLCAGDIPEETFCKNNPQLKTLHIASGESIIRCVTKYLVNLEKLSIRIGPDSIEARKINQIRSLKKLTKLELKLVLSYHFDDILQMVSLMKDLTNIKIEIYDNGCPRIYHSLNENILRAIMQNLTKLRVFHLTHVHFTDDKLIDFIKNVPGLEEIGIIRCQVNITDDLLNKLENARSFAKNNLSNQILKIVINPVENNEEPVSLRDRELRKNCIQNPDLKFIKVVEIPYDSYM